jgi:hypothetical protein
MNKNLKNTENEAQIIKKEDLISTTVEVST